jgi:molybdenum cofactor biosynthesis enzyme MoaA
MNLIVVDKCTNHCAYCFAATEMAKSTARGTLSRSDIEILVEFVRRSGPGFQLNVIGGEPFLYPDLSYLLDRLYSLQSFDSATVFTGAIFNSQALHRIAHHAERTGILVNLNERRDYQHASEYDVVLRNVESFVDTGFHVSIGFNIWRSDFDYYEILDVCRRHGIEHLRWTVAYPESKPKPGITVLRPDQYPEVARRCAAMLEAAYASGIDAYLARIIREA